LFMLWLMRELEMFIKKRHIIIKYDYLVVWTLLLSYH
jgi:hypothetical protein